MNNYSLVYRPSSDDRDEYIIVVTSENALQIELLLNKSPYGYFWSDLGDILYKWYNDCPVNPTYIITIEQYNWLLTNSLHLINTNDRPLLYI